MSKYRVIVKERNQKNIRPITKIFDNLLLAKVAFDAAKAGYGNRFINKHFTFIKIEVLSNDES